MTTDNIQQKLEEVAGDRFEMRIDNNELVITPAEAGVALLAAVSQMNEDDSEGWQEAERLGRIVEELRTENAELRDLFETVHGTLVAVGQDVLADRLMRAVYPVAGVLDDGTVVRFEEDK